MATGSDFTSLLDELMASAKVVDEDGVAVETVEPASPTINVDYLSVAEELGRISITSNDAISEYRLVTDEVPPIEPELEEIVIVGELPSVDPDDIARELCIARIDVGHELDRVRRDFAFANHPDRVDDWMRETAATRMQIANQLIDEAKRKLAGRVTRPA